MSKVIKFLAVLLCGIGIVSSANAQNLNLAPDCSQAIATPNRLWPANHDLIPITISGVTDPDNHALTLTTQCIVQDEPLNATADGNTDIDGAGLNSDQPLVRSERAANRDGRVYHIVFKVTDTEGAKCAAQVAVKVPHSAKTKTIVDSGQRFVSALSGENCDAQPINNPPIIYSVPVVDAQVGREYQYDVQGHDPDQGTMQYSLVNPPADMVINAQSGLIQWTPVAEQEGNIGIVVKVTDPGGLSGTQSYEVFVEAATDQLSAQIIANPESGTSPLTVRFSPVVQNNNLVINSYQWDFNGDGLNDVSDTFGAPKTYTYTGSPSDEFIVRLTVNPAGADPIIATKTITIDNAPPTALVSTNVTNGHPPLEVVFSVTASDPQGIGEVSIDYEGDGVFDETQTGGANSGTWQFNKTYEDEGTYLPRVRVTDSVGAETIVTNNAISVDVNNPLDPTVQLRANPVVGNASLTTTLTASAQLFDGGDIAQWVWDLDGDGQFEAQGSAGITDSIQATYSGVNYYYPMVEVTTTTGRTARASLRIETQSTAVPSISIPDSSDTINVDANEQAAITVTLPYETEMELWIENANGGRVQTVQAQQTMLAGQHTLNWGGMDSLNRIVPAGDYYAVLGYNRYGAQQVIDLRTSTGGQLSYYRRTTSNPRTFDRLESPLIINFRVDDPAEVTFFWQISFGQRLMTLMEHERMGRGQYSLYWNGDYPSGEKLPSNIDRLMPGIVRYALPSNVIFVKEDPRIKSYALKSTIIADPRREPIGINLTLSKDSAVEMVVSDMEKGVDVVNRLFVDLPAGKHNLTWDGKNNNDQYLTPGDYRIGVRSVDEQGSRSLFWYRTQRIEY
ncbi:MAG: FlgD immunoglobulin-like domain containing protein [Sedimenticola sp.]